MAGRKLTLTFGLVSIAVKSDGATEKAPDLTNMCVGQPGHDAHEALPVKAPRTCTMCDVITDYSVLVKGVKSGSTYTIIEQSQVVEAKESYASEHKGVLNLVPHPAQEFLAETAPGDTVHYLTPADTGSEGHYQLMVKLIESHPELVFASLYTPVSATGLYMVRARDGVLVMEKRVRSQAMKPTPSVGGEVNDALYTMLESVLPSFVTDYDADAYEDKYETALAEMIAAGAQVAVTEGTTTKAAPLVSTDADLLAKLQALADNAAKPAKKKAPTKKKTAAAA